MELIVCKAAQDVARFADQWLANQVVTSQTRSLYLPAGATPEPLYRLWRETAPDYLEELQLVQIDDVLTGDKARCFQRFFKETLPDLERKFVWLDGCDFQADAAILGLGLNGHVAFHEPGLPPRFFSGCVALSRQTCDRLNLTPGTWGLTYGLGAFLRCRAILLMVTGTAKHEILSRFLQRQGDFPALHLREHSSLTVVCDQFSKGL